MLCLIVLTFVHFQISHGFHFDFFSGAVTVGTPIVLSWHRDTSNTGQIGFRMVPLQDPSDSATITTTDTTQLNGTVTLTLLDPGFYFVAAIGPNSTTMTTSQTFKAASGSGESSTMSSLSQIETTSVFATSSIESAQSTSPGSTNDSSTTSVQRIRIRSVGITLLLVQ
ncbi:hypothetical protein IW261DRAFT_1524491 [Armillaria novae-zelandiae]|uniref:Uncharacterized protein n=1 Tax=Armillaria novae-zelandiae TaxID=153914 RepID=A0AA39NEH6_9AGAR|nr:hypothetical protein IW261DRAFT_1524491 [Armillaria novae-zelandiae]